MILQDWHTFRAVPHIFLCWTFQPPSGSMGNIECTVHSHFHFDAWHSGQRVQSLFHETREFCFSWSESLSGAFWQTPDGLLLALYRGGFRLAHLCSTPPIRPVWRSAAEMVVLLEGYPLSTEKRWSSVRVTILFLVTALIKALLPRQPALGRVQVVPIFFYLWMMEATVLIGTFNAAEMFMYLYPDLCLNTTLSQSSTDKSLDFMPWFVVWHALSTVRPHIDRCVPLQILPNQLNLPQVDSNQVVKTSHGWSAETGCTWAQFWVSWQRLWILMCMWVFFIFNTFATISKKLLSVTSQWGMSSLGLLSCEFHVLFWKVTLLSFQVTCPSSCVPGLMSSLILDCFHLCSPPPCV